jgi:hypothetical protein
VWAAVVLDSERQPVADGSQSQTDFGNSPTQQRLLNGRLRNPEKSRRGIRESAAGPLEFAAAPGIGEVHQVLKSCDDTILLEVRALELAQLKPGLIDGGVDALLEPGWFGLCVATATARHSGQNGRSRKCLQQPIMQLAG